MNPSNLASPQMVSNLGASTTPMAPPNEDGLSPETFKAQVIKANPNAKSSAGVPYAQIPALTILNGFLAQNPNAVTKKGVPYKAYLPDTGLNAPGPAPAGPPNAFSNGLTNIASGDNQANQDTIKGALEGILNVIRQTSGVDTSPVVKGQLAAAPAFAADVAAEKNAIQPTNLDQQKGAMSTYIGANLIDPGATDSGAAVADTASGLRQAASGITPQIGNMLKDVGDTSQYDRYINASKAFAQNARNPSALDEAGNDVQTVADMVNKNLSAAGEAKGTALAANATKPLADTSAITQGLAQEAAQRYGLQLGTDETGKVTSSIMDGREQTLTPSDQARIEDAYQKVLNLQGGTVQRGQDVVNALRNNISYAKNSRAVGTSFDPVEQLLQSTIGKVSDATHAAAPDLAAADARFSQVKDLSDQMDQMAGNRLQRGSLLMKRIFSGDMGAEGKALFDALKNETGIDLVNSATLAKHAVAAVGNSTEKSLLSQAIEGAATAHGGIIPAILNAGGHVARNMFANPVSMGRNLVENGPTGGSSLAGLIPQILASIAIGSGATALNQNK